LFVLFESLFTELKNLFSLRNESASKLAGFRNYIGIYYINEFFNCRFGKKLSPLGILPKKAVYGYTASSRGNLRIKCRIFWNFDFLAKYGGQSGEFEQKFMKIAQVQIWPLIEGWKYTYTQLFSDLTGSRWLLDWGGIVFFINSSPLFQNFYLGWPAFWGAQTCILWYIRHGI
jgi:hypothetical protein